MDSFVLEMDEDEQNIDFLLLAALAPQEAVARLQNAKHHSHPDSERLQEKHPNDQNWRRCRRTLDSQVGHTWPASLHGF